MLQGLAVREPAAAPRATARAYRPVAALRRPFSPARRQDLAGASEEVLLRIAQDSSVASLRRRAADVLLSRCRDLVVGWCLRLLRDPDRAQDAAQDTLLLAWRHLPGFDGRSRFSTWLYPIARRRCLALLRPRVLARDADVDPAQLVADEADPLERLGWRQVHDDALDTIEHALLPHEREALRLRVIEELGVDEITLALGFTSASGARGVLQAARRKLRASLPQHAEAIG